MYYLPVRYGDTSEHTEFGPEAALAPSGFSHPAALSACQRFNARALPPPASSEGRHCARLLFGKMLLEVSAYVPAALFNRFKKHYYGLTIHKSIVIYRPLTCGYETY